MVRITAAALATYGTVVLVAPQVLPTYMANMRMPAAATPTSTIVANPDYQLEMVEVQAAGPSKITVTVRLAHVVNVRRKPVYRCQPRGKGVRRSMCIERVGTVSHQGPRSSRMTGAPASARRAAQTEPPETVADDDDLWSGHLSRLVVTAKNIVAAASPECNPEMPSRRLSAAPVC